MTTLAMRPTFDLDPDLSPEEAAHRLATIIGAGDGPIVGETVGNHLMLAIRRRDRHVFSPWLTLEIRPADPADDPPGDPPRTTIHARFHPHPSLWTAFMMGYLALATIASFAAIFAGCQMVLDATPWAAWILPACALVAGAMWVASQVGQRLGADQMDLLRTAVEKALDSPEGLPTTNQT